MTMTVVKNANQATAQASNVTFELQTLGLEAVQNLCGHVIREVLGQTATVFSPTNDAGQDGAFQGVWEKTKNEVFSGRFIIQCKFTARREEHLNLSALVDELMKAKALAEQGLVQTYLLMTNAKVSGKTENLIRKAFLKIKGINHFDLLGSEWITQQILESKRLRAFVPRIYGLGDLSQILDERVYQQANEILQTWRDNLSKFVPTEAHLKSIKALLSDGFVLLLGDPMAGKSTIAAALALAAADQWKCLPIFVSHPDDFKTHWNPNEPNQFFWVDDAFGQTQLESSLAEGWNRLFPLLATAIRKGARVLFTSRTYIYQAAKRELKESAFPLIQNSRVVIEVEELTLQEKERILYNHLRLGSQSSEFLREIKAFLPSIAANPKFFPEIAKRLGDSFFTRKLRIDSTSLKQFVGEPKGLLGEIIGQLDRRNFAALALLFMRAGRIAIPLEIVGNENRAMAQLGADLAQVREALSFLNGSLVSLSFETAERLWKFRHPSIRDAMAACVAAQPDLVDIYLNGVKTAELLREVVCGEIPIEGAKVHVPASRFAAVILKIRGLDFDDWSLRFDMINFLNRRCSGEFLATWYADCPGDLERLEKAFPVDDYHVCVLVVNLYRLGCLPEKYRRDYIEKATRAAIDSSEASFLSEEFREFFLPGEFESVLNRLKEELIPNLYVFVDALMLDYCDDDRDPSRLGEPADHFSDFYSSLENFRDASDDPDMVMGFENGLELVEEAISRSEQWKLGRTNFEKLRREREFDDEMYANMSAQHDRPQSRGRSRNDSENVDAGAVIHHSPRSIFDDIDG